MRRLNIEQIVFDSATFLAFIFDVLPLLIAGGFLKSCYEALLRDASPLFFLSLWLLTRCKTHASTSPPERLHRQFLYPPGCVPPQSFLNANLSATFLLSQSSYGYLTDPVTPTFNFIINIRQIPDTKG